MNKHNLNPCECGCTNVVETECNGISVEYDCASCGTFIAELLLGPEP